MARIICVCNEAASVVCTNCLKGIKLKPVVKMFCDSWKKDISDIRKKVNPTKGV